MDLGTGAYQRQGDPRIQCVGRLKEIMMTDKQKIIGEILDYELEMFLKVNSRGKAACQDNPDGFKFYRGAMFSVWSIKALESYRKMFNVPRKRAKIYSL